MLSNSLQPHLVEFVVIERNKEKDLGNKDKSNKSLFDCVNK